MNSKLVEEKRLRGEAMKLQARIDATPAVESEMTNITRDYTQLNAQYGSLLAKREDSKLAANLERRQIGEQFTLLDAARVPERPFKPDRRQINLMGMASASASAWRSWGCSSTATRASRRTTRSFACCRCRCSRWCR